MRLEVKRHLLEFMKMRRRESNDLGLKIAGFTEMLLTCRINSTRIKKSKVKARPHQRDETLILREKCLRSLFCYLSEY